MPPSSREIPFNYTSADDAQVVTDLLGAQAWQRMESLRGLRVTGRSARLLLRLLGEAWLLRRNPYLFQDLLDHPAHRRRFLAACRHDLELVALGAEGQPDALALVAQCGDLLKALEASLQDAPGRRARLEKALGAVVGPANVLCDPFSLVSHATDATDWRLHLPLAVVFPTREEEVPALLKAIGGLGLKAVPRGAGTGLTGGAVPTHPDSVMINTERLNRLRGIQAEDLGGGRRGWVLEAEAGLVTESAIRAAAGERLVFATDPTSAWACTLGGNLAENAGGKTAVLWGTAMDNVLRWNLALPDGRFCRVRRLEHPLRKILPGDVLRWEIRLEGEAPRILEMRGDQVRRPGLWKDVTRKALGGLPGLQKEGTDGVITSCAFVLHAPYPCKNTACLEFFGADMREASQVIQDLTRAFPDADGAVLQALEHFDEEYAEAIGYKVKAARADRPKAVLLVDLAARDPGTLAQARGSMQDILRRYPNTECRLAAGAEEAGRFWADRKKMGAIARRTNAFKLNEDVALPLGRLADFAAFLERLNLREEAHNHGQVIARMRSWARQLSPRGDESWALSKIPAVERLCAQAEADGAAADRETLRRGGILARLVAGLQEAYTGAPQLCAEARRLHDEERGRLVVIATHMHAGDGNVHVNIPVFSNDREMMRRASQAAETVLRQAVALGGAVSGEHGIGITKVAHLDPAELAALRLHRAALDPAGIMNPLKLDDTRLLEKVFTRTFNLLNLEARILQHDHLEELARKIQACVRCGKCKPDCCVFSPAQALFFHPRNKNLAVGAIIEALLYEAQRTHGERWDVLKYLRAVSDHCTLCHKCLAPCPVDIDTGEVSLLQRQILGARRYKRTALAVRMSLAYLASRNQAVQAVFRIGVLKAGVRCQRLASRWARRIGRLVPLLAKARIFDLVARPLRLPSARTLAQALPARGRGQALILRGAGPGEKVVFYFPGCGSERLFGEVGEAALYILLKAGATAVLPPPSLCCGFPFGAAGRSAQQRAIELKNAIIFSQMKEMMGYLPFNAVAVSCGTCLEALERQGVAAIFNAPLADASAWALEHGLSAAPLGEALYHRPCHDSLRGRGLATLRAAGGQVRDVPACCGEAGTLALNRPDIGAKLLDRKEAEIRLALGRGQAGAALPLMTNCPSCLQGLGRQEALGVKVKHMAVALAEKTSAAWRSELAAWSRAGELVTF